MSKQIWKPSNMLCPVPAVFITTGRYERPGDEAYCDVMTAAWCGTICSDPAMTYVSVRPERYTHELLTKYKEFTIGVPSSSMTRSLDYCGVVSGRKENKFETRHLPVIAGDTVKAPVLEDCPITLECQVTEVLPLGSHDMFLAKITAVQVDDTLLDENGKLCLSKADLIAYSHGEYFKLGKKIGKFGYSVRKKTQSRRQR